MIKYKSIFDDYNEDARKMAHYLKGEDINGNPISKAEQMKAIKRAARELSKICPKGATIIPIPSHKGNATDTLMLAREISKLTGNKVEDIMKSPERRSSYQAKKNGETMSGKDFGFYFTKKPKGKVVYLDNVLSSGATIKAANEIHKGSALVYTSVHAVDGFERVTSNNSLSLAAG